MARKNPSICNERPNKKCGSPAKAGERMEAASTPELIQSRGPSPRTSPGLLAGHYAGCKWTEPPAPSALPPPPQHWMQAAPHPKMVAFRAATKAGSSMQQHQQHDIANQLKVLLKVHA